MLYRALNRVSLSLFFVLASVFALGACAEDAAVVPNNGDGTIYETVFTDVVETADTGVDEAAPEVETATPICTPGEAVCAGEKGIKTCAADGLAWTEEDCYYVCKEATPGKAQCRDKVCEPGSHRCAGNRNLLICEPDGTEYAKYPCPEGALCDPTVQPEPECVAGPACQANQKECDESGKFLKVCVKKGEAYTYDWQKCSFGCDAAALSCLEASCADGAARCDPDNSDAIQECNKDRTGWNFVQDCDDGCINGKCIDMPCSQGEKRCNFYAVEVCKDNGSGFEFEQGCPVACVEDGTNAYCSGCVPGAQYCEDGKVVACNDPAEGPVVVATCGAGTSCFEAACVDSIVLSDELDIDRSLLNLAEAITFCWKDNEGADDNVMCGVVNASAFSLDITPEDFIDNWYCDETTKDDYIYWEFTYGDDPNEDPFWLAEGLFSCFEPDNRVVDMKASIGEGSTNVCVWYDTFVTDEIVIDLCSSFDSLF